MAKVIGVVAEVLLFGILDNLDGCLGDALRLQHYILGY